MMEALNDAVTGPGGGVKAPKKWPDNFVNDTSSTYNNWHGASRETGITVVPWNTSEFGYTANVPCHLSKVGRSCSEKKMGCRDKRSYFGCRIYRVPLEKQHLEEFKKMNWVKKRVLICWREFWIQTVKMENSVLWRQESSWLCRKLGAGIFH